MAKLKTEVCAAQTLINCANWNPNLAFVVTYQGIMIADGNVDLEGFVSIVQIFNINCSLSSFPHSALSSS